MPLLVLFANFALVPMIDASMSSRGLSIALSGLTIVFAALLLITLFIAALPHLLGMLHRVWPEVDHSHAHDDYPESQIAEDEAVLAAIGYVLHTEFQRYRDVKSN